jgi:cystathionine beta-lyase/cystathionine gamma-synthase
VWLESPTNPLLKVMDIKKIAEITRKKGILLAVDNTFLTSYFQVTFYCQTCNICLYCLLRHVTNKIILLKPIA